MRTLTTIILMGGILSASGVALAQEPPPAYPAPPIAQPAPPVSPGYAPVMIRPRVRKTTRITRPNAVYVELGGKGLVYSVGYDHAIFKWLAAGGSFSYFKMGEVSTVFVNPYVSFYPAGGIRNALLMQLGANFVYFSHKHDFFMPAWADEEGFGFSGNVSIGYEYRGPFLFRVQLLGFFSEEGLYPWLGLTFGGTF